ncbi:hypothetical protein HELRODRAFT_161349 [Helobdella robusta]|uniref:Uncharacterized protein n=1 Tax=Helobdella robusta TaxID=6412 RepID=T1ERD5_HELRO|nr:hypothetical protein HELRODRAFT_161349 [Helobdella robusta]ESO02113.1 hypothetical protein HELRODRAFT_161349 [Helobdella robusta]
MVILFVVIFLVGALTHPVPIEEKKTSAADKAGDDHLEFILSEISKKILNLINFLEVLGKNSLERFHEVGCPTDEELYDNIPRDNDDKNITENNIVPLLTEFYIKQMECLSLLKNLRDRFHMNDSDVNQHFNKDIERFKVMLVSLDHLSITILHLLKQYMSDSIGKALMDSPNVNEFKLPAFHSKEVNNEIPCLIMYALRKLKEIDVNVSISSQNLESNSDTIKKNFQKDGKKVTNDDIATHDAKFTTEPMTTTRTTISDVEETKYSETPTSNITNTSEVTNFNKFDNNLTTETITVAITTTADTTSIPTNNSNASKSFVARTTNAPPNDLMINSNIFTSMSSYEWTISTASQIKTRPGKHISA